MTDTTDEGLGTEWTPQLVKLGIKMLQDANKALEQRLGQPLGQPNAEEFACEAVGITTYERLRLALQHLPKHPDAIEAEATWRRLVEQIARKRAEVILAELLDPWYGLEVAEMVQEHVGDVIKAHYDSAAQELAKIEAFRRANDETNT